MIITLTLKQVIRTATTLFAAAFLTAFLITLMALTAKPANATEGVRYCCDYRGQCIVVSRYRNCPYPYTTES